MPMYRHELIQHLRDLCADLYGDAASARRVASDAGLDLVRLPFQGSAQLIWQALVEEALRQQRMAALVALVQQEFPRHDQVTAAVAAYDRWRDAEQPVIPITTPRNPFQYLLPVEPDAFVGRRALARQITIDLTVDNGDSHALIAGRRCGKSSLLMAVAHQLRQQPAQTGAGDWLALPLYFDFKAVAFPSVEAFFARILDELCRRVDSNTRRPPPDAWPTPVRLDAGWFAELTAQAELTLRDFEDAAGYLLERLATAQTGVRLVLLLDEIDETLDKPWNTDLFNQLRALVYSGDLRTQVRIVVAGSRRFLDQVSDRGSPLWNVLKLHYLTVFDSAGFAELTARWQSLPESITNQVWAQSGGHPFLAQYLYHHLWAQQNTTTDAGQIDNLVRKFQAEQAKDLEGWLNGIEVAGLHAYMPLHGSAAWMTEEKIAAELNQSAQATKRGLTALCYHGLVAHDNWRRYRGAGQLFGAWFEQYATESLKPNEKMTVAAAEAVVQQITNNIYTAGGSYIDGNVETDGGGFTGRDQSE